MKAILCTRHGVPDDLVLADLPEPQAGVWQLGEVQVPVSTGKAQEESLEPRQLLEKFFQLARRKKRRREEAEGRLTAARERLSQLEPKREIPAGDWLQNEPECFGQNEAKISRAPGASSFHEWRAIG